MFMSQTSNGKLNFFFEKYVNENFTQNFSLIKNNKTNEKLICLKIKL